MPVVVPVVERGSGSAGKVSDATASRSPLAPGSHTESLSSSPSELAVRADPCREATRAQPTEYTSCMSTTQQTGDASRWIVPAMYAGIARLPVDASLCGTKMTVT